MKRKRGEPTYAEDPDEGDSEGKSESLEVTGSEASDSGEEGDTGSSESESEEESGEEDTVRSKILISNTRTSESTSILWPAQTGAGSFSIMINFLGDAIRLKIVFLQLSLKYYFRASASTK
jgi:hypothetical protein